MALFWSAPGVGPDAAPVSPVVEIGQFRTFRGNSDPQLEDRIAQSLEQRFRAQGLLARRVPRTLPNSADSASADFFVTGFYRRSPSGAVSLYGHVYHTRRGTLIDAYNLETNVELAKDIDLDPTELSEDTVIGQFTNRLVGRVLSNPRRAVRHQNINRFVVYHSISKSHQFALEKEAKSEASREVFGIFTEQTTSIVSRRVGRGESTRNAAAVVSVVSRIEIEDSAARNLADILKPIPGVEISYDQFGFYKVSFRGIRSRSGVLLLLDGHRINNFYDGSTFLDLRADLIERVEVIRGPGSSVHGTNAFVGVINVQTRELPEGQTAQTRVSTRLGALYTTAESQVFHGTGLAPETKLEGRKEQHHRLSVLEPSVFYGSRLDDWTFTVQAHHYQDHRQSFHVEHDDTCNPNTWNDAALVLQRRNCDSTLLPLPLNPGVRTNDDKKQSVVFLRWVHPSSFFIGIKHLTETRGPHMGELTQITPESELRSRLSVFDMGFRDVRVSDKLSYNVRVYSDGFSKRDQIQTDRADNLVHFGTSARKEIAYRYATFGSETIFDWQIHRHNTLVLGVQVERLKVSDFAIEQNYAGKDTGTLFLQMADYDGLAKSQNTQRTNMGAFVQDIWRMFATLTLTLGVRYDRYESYQEAISPKGGLVWTAISSASLGRLILKLLYGEAFRAPTFQELHDQTQKFQQSGVFGNVALRPETIQSAEFVLEYESPWKPLSILWNAYSNRISDNIEGSNTSGTFPGTDDLYRNLHGIRVVGYEAELRITPQRRYYGFVNYSWFRAEDLGGFPDFPDRKVHTYRLDVPQWRANLGVQVGLGAYLDLYNAVWVSSERWTNYRFPFEAQANRRFYFPRYGVWNLSLASSENLWQNARLRFSVFNVTDTPLFDDTNAAEDSYKNRAVPVQGRYVELRLDYVL